MSTSRQIPTSQVADDCTLLLRELGIAIDLQATDEGSAESVEFEYVGGMRLQRRPRS